MSNHHEIGLVDDPGERDYYSTCPNCSAKILETGLESQIVCTCCNFTFKSNANSILRIQNGEIEQRYLNKREQSCMSKKRSNPTRSNRASMPSNMQHLMGLDGPQDQYDGVDNDNEGEGESEDDEYAFDQDGNPFQVNHYENAEEDKIDYNEHPIVQSQSKELQTVTLLVIEETLLDDFKINRKADQKKELNSIGQMVDPLEPKHNVNKDKLTHGDVKNNLQGEVKCNQQDEGEHKGKVIL